MHPLEVLIALRSNREDTMQKIRSQFSKTDIYALGEPAGDTSTPGQGTESDLLHFAIDDEKGGETVMLPVFTRTETIRDAVVKNPEWQALSVLQINGQALLDNVDHDVTIIINPWSDLEFQIPPSI